MEAQYIKINERGSKFYYKDRKMRILHRTDGPAVEWYDGDKEWYFNGKRHRTDGPAIEWYDGAKEWYVNGELHREDGPAIEYASGDKRFYINGKYLTKDEFLKRTAPEIVLTMDEIATKFGVDVSKLKIKK